MVKIPLTHRQWARIAAVLLFCFLICLTISGVVVSVFAYSDGWYGSEEMDFTESSLCRSHVLNDISEVTWRYESWLSGNDSLPEYEDVTYRIYLNWGDNNNTEIQYDSTTTYSKLVYSGIELLGGQYLLDAYFEDTGNPSHYYALSYRFFYWAYGHYKLFIPLTVLSALFTLIVFIFLMLSAGHRQGAEGIVIQGLNRIPLDLYVVLLFLLVIAINSYVIDQIDYIILGTAPRLLIGLFVVCFDSLMLLALCMTMSVRFKAGKWWQNTIIFFIFSGILRLIRAIPISWKAALLYLAFVLLMIVLFLNESFFMGWLLLISGLIVIILWSSQLHALLKAGKALSKGDLNYTVNTKGMWMDCRRHGENLNSISAGLNKAVAERIKSERMKTELITNVSHDIKTPLTSIISYIDLLKKEQLNNEAASEYIQVIDRQSQRLKKLTEDVVEASKASTGNIPVNLISLDISELMDQVAGEYKDKFRDNSLELIINPVVDCAIMADSRLLGRVFDNLLENVCKYAQRDTRVFINTELNHDKVNISIKNTSRDILNISADELMERFVRGDSARSGEGSGLGLSIVQSLVELQGGKFYIRIDGDLFKAIMIFDGIFNPEPKEITQ